ncbi:hypothetical protein FMEXI_8236 [Fusarium mexicanum]|uniref:Uncharacterized protein n=1 Tax=Fusarium mexicanum TaxID=751941 RepID=A0A8H5IRN4_9HYPO|nr:hypothetical protein FMEXI_8236 [Fusarium mexicanum]
MLIPSFFIALGVSPLVHAHGIRVERSENRLIKGPAFPDDASSSSMEPVWHAKQGYDELLKVDFHRLIQRRDDSSTDTDSSADATSTATKDASMYYARHNYIGDGGIYYRRKLRVVNHHHLELKLRHSIIDKHDFNFNGTRRFMLQYDSQEQHHLRNNRIHHIDVLCCEYNLEHMFSGSYMHDPVKQRSHDLYGTPE